jgi:uncharacterized protein YndB with AHSA1/START domain
MTQHLILKKERQINASPAKVWAVLTNNEWIIQWLGVEMITDWQTGNPIEFTFVYKEKEIKDKGILLTLDPEKKFAYTYWSVFSATEDKPENYSEITFELTPKGEGVRLQLTHSNFATETMYEHSNKNWEETLDTIQQLAEEEDF